MKTLRFVDEINQEESVYLLPGEWDELTADQLLFLIELVNKNISAEEIKLKLLLFCLKGRIRKDNIDMSFRLKIGRKYFDLSAEELHAVSEIFEYLFTRDENIRINPLLVKNPFPAIRIGWIKLYGPADGLTDFSYQQFMELQIAQSETDESPEKFNLFISSMYKRRNGKQSKWFRFVSRKKKIAILWFYLGCINFFQERFPLVFSGESAADIVDGQMRIVDALAKNDVTKKALVRNSDLYEALYTMQIAAEESEKLRKPE
ncbi:MAG: hypothetical protein E6767_20485 [Dysgonomonas sp.]|nr:hypothetical protein [Dysgonomonas sp.]